MKTSLLSISADAKTKKGEKFGFLTGILYLAPFKESGVMNACAHSSAGCRGVCLFDSGMRSVFKTINEASIRKTRELKANKQEFLSRLGDDIGWLVAQAHSRGLRPAVRLNGTSDLPWHTMPIEGKASLLDAFPGVQFYDYTPNWQRMAQWQAGKLPRNYHLTFSRKEDNEPIARQFLASGANVAVVFHPSHPQTFWDTKVIDGDKSDLRFKDPQGVVVGLSAKGKAKKDMSGFVIRYPDGSLAAGQR